MLNKNKNLNQNLNPLFQPQHLTREQFKQISSYMEKYTGIKMPISKQAMIQARLSNRLKALGFNSYSQYIEYAFSPNSNKTNELTMMVDLLTTNLTLFFRELPHFNFLNEKELPNSVVVGDPYKPRFYYYSTVGSARITVTMNGTTFTAGTVSSGETIELDLTPRIVDGENTISIKFANSATEKYVNELNLLKGV